MSIREYKMPDGSIMEWHYTDPSPNDSIHWSLDLKTGTYVSVKHEEGTVLFAPYRGDLSIEDAQACIEYARGESNV